jgi:hypothetical protein
MALEPITRQEKIIAGQDLTPITRMEMFLKQYGGGSGGGGADWDAVEGEPGYIQNRPFGKTEVILFPETEVAFVDMDGMMMAGLPANVKLEADTEYKIVYNEVEYLRKPCLMDGNPVGLGNTVVMGGDDTGEPFFIMIDMDESGVLTAIILALDGTTSTTVSCKGYPEKTLDIKYIPNAAENVIDLTALGVTALGGTTSYTTLPEDTINQIKKQLATGQVTLRFAVNIAFNDILAGVTVDGIRYLRLVAPTVVITEPSEAYTVTARYQDALFVFEFHGTQVRYRAEDRSPS